MKQKVYDILSENQIFIKFIYGLIVLNVISLILESYHDIKVEYSYFLDIFEIISVIVFTIEYVLRFWTADLCEDFSGTSFRKRVQFTFSGLGLIDLISILPFYLPLFFTFDLRILRILRLFRLLRIFKLGRYSKSFKIITSVLKESKSELGVTVFVAFVMLVLSSTLMYYIENEVQPENFASIGHAFWWAVATLTTVGYGDVYPMTGMGKFLSGFIALIGIGFIALPTGIISSVFVEKVQQENAKKEALKKAEEQDKTCTCPNCGTTFKPEEHQTQT